MNAPDVRVTAREIKLLADLAFAAGVIAGRENTTDCAIPELLDVHIEEMVRAATGDATECAAPAGEMSVPVRAVFGLYPVHDYQPPPDGSPAQCWHTWRGDDVHAARLAKGQTYVCEMPEGDKVHDTMPPPQVPVPHEFMHDRSRNWAMDVRVGPVCQVETGVGFDGLCRLPEADPVHVTCTCPSGDGSLRWPCPVHPPVTTPLGSGLITGCTGSTGTCVAAECTPGTPVADGRCVPSHLRAPK